MVAVPAEAPLTTPLEAPIVATAGLLLLHVPPVTALLSVVVPPTQIVVVPVIADVGLTVSVAVEKQPPP